MVLVHGGIHTTDCLRNYTHQCLLPFRCPVPAQHVNMEGHRSFGGGTIHLYLEPPLFLYGSIQCLHNAHHPVRLYLFVVFTRTVLNQAPQCVTVGCSLRASCSSITTTRSASATQSSVRKDRPRNRRMPMVLK